MNTDSILAALRRNEAGGGARLSTREVAREVGETPDATLRALKRLERAGKVAGQKERRYDHVGRGDFFGGAAVAIRRFYTWRTVTEKTQVPA